MRHEDKSPEKLLVGLGMLGGNALALTSILENADSTEEVEKILTDSNSPSDMWQALLPVFSHLFNSRLSTNKNVQTRTFTALLKLKIKNVDPTFIHRFFTNLKDIRADASRIQLIETGLAEDQADEFIKVANNIMLRELKLYLALPGEIMNVLTYCHTANGNLRITAEPPEEYFLGTTTEITDKDVVRGTGPDGDWSVAISAITSIEMT